MKKKIVTLLPTMTANRLSISLSSLIDLVREYDLSEYHIKYNSLVDIMRNLDEQIEKSTIKMTLSLDQYSVLNDSISQIIEKGHNLTKKERNEIESIKNQLCGNFKIVV